jgi:hypothetical protein
VRDPSEAELIVPALSIGVRSERSVPLLLIRTAPRNTIRNGHRDTSSPRFAPSVEWTSLLTETLLPGAN